MNVQKISHAGRQGRFDFVVGTYARYGEILVQRFRGFGVGIIFCTFLNGSNVISGYVGYYFGWENGCGCKQKLMGTGRCVRALLGGCLPGFWWGGQGVLVFVWVVGSNFWVFGMCGF
jgi:hypothetical protein